MKKKIASYLSGAILAINSFAVVYDSGKIHDAFANIFVFLTSIIFVLWTFVGVVNMIVSSTLFKEFTERTGITPPMGAMRKFYGAYISGDSAALWYDYLTYTLTITLLVVGGYLWTAWMWLVIAWFDVKKRKSAIEFKKILQREHE